MVIFAETTDSVWREAKTREIAGREMATSNSKLVGSSGRELDQKVGGKSWKRATPESAKLRAGKRERGRRPPRLLGFAPGQVGHGNIRFSVIKENTVNGVKYWDSLSPLSQKWYLNREWTQPMSVRREPVFSVTAANWFCEKSS
jgi:hypothetical protein